jgi:RNA polymerase primary sigma factor
MNELIAKWRKTKEQLSQKLKRIPSNQEVAKKMKISANKTEEINFWLSTQTSSLDAPIGEEGEGEVLDLLEDETAVSPDSQIEHLLDKERVSYLLERVSEKEKSVLDMRFGLAKGKPHTLAEVARKMCLSRERVRQIEEKPLRKLRQFIQQQEK